MVHHHRYNQWRKHEIHQQNEEEEFLGSVCANYKRKRPKLVFLLFLSLLSFFLILSPHLFCRSSSAFSLLYSFVVENDAVVSDSDLTSPLCSAVSNGTMCCDRTSIRTDICVMKGDVRTHSSSSSIFLYTSKNTTAALMKKDREIQHEIIKPYTRKWEESVMDTIDQLHLIEKSAINSHKCDVKHDVPAVFFSTGGYTGNVYHEFNDGILPLYITSHQFDRKVVFVILEYHDWWMMKYGDVVSRLSDYSPIDFSQDTRIHCFPEAIVGLRIHDELTINPSLPQGNKNIVDFRNLLDKAYSPRIKGLRQNEEEKTKLNRPKLVILSRNGSRAITNEGLLVKMAKEIGFGVKVLRPDPTTELAKIYGELNSSEVMIGVHGAAMTHFLFMRPGSVFMQVIPLGTDWAAETYYGEPAKKLGLKYIGYKILPKESSLYDQYDSNDPVLKDPQSISQKGWEYTKTIYLDRQNVKLNLRRFKKRLILAYEYSVRKMNHRSQ